MYLTENQGIFVVEVNAMGPKIGQVKEKNDSKFFMTPLLLQVVVS